MNVEKKLKFDVIEKAKKTQSKFKNNLKNSIMTTKEFLNGTKEVLIANETSGLMAFKSYQDGTRNAIDQAHKNYLKKGQSINQQKWFKVIKQENGMPTIVWTNNGSSTTLVYDDGNIKFDEEVNGSVSVCRVIGASSINFISFYGNILEVIEAVKNDNFSHSKSDLIAPVEFFT
jgi:hypothetical protein